MSWIDYLIVAVPLSLVLGLSFYTRRYIRGVPDFISAGRLCGRYIISVASVASGLSIMGVVSCVEVNYRNGFALTFWNTLVLPLSVILGLSGYVTYRFRETRALSFGQFLEIRYSRGLRIYAAALRSLSEMLANMIMPAIAARFFIHFLGLPHSFLCCGIEIPTFMVLVVAALLLAYLIIWSGGLLSITVTDSVQGLMLYPLLVLFSVFILCKFSWSREIVPVMMDRVEGESFLNPYDLFQLRDFNFLMLGWLLFSMVLHRGSWMSGGGSSARNPHEQKMAGLLGEWRGQLNTVFAVLISIAVITLLNHRNFADDAARVRGELGGKVAETVVSSASVRNALTDAMKKVPIERHEIGRDPARSEKCNADTPYLESVRQVLAAEENGNALFQEFRTLYHQMMMAATMRNLLPVGMMGLFCLMMVLAMISTDDSRIYSAASTIAQDFILPLRKKPFTPAEHLRMIRLVALGICVFFFFGSFCMSQLDYINLFVTLMTMMWIGGSGPVVIFGLYSRFGTTAGAWTSLLSGMGLSVGSIALQRNWAGTVYPWLADHGYAEAVGNFLESVSAPLNPIVVWKMNPLKFPINSYELSFLVALTTLALYCVVSLLTCRKPFNLDRMLHRGIYAVEGDAVPRRSGAWRGILQKLIGISDEYTRGDKAIAWGLFLYSFAYKFGLAFLAVVIWNALSPWPIEWWGNYFLVVTLVVPGIVAAITTVWFGIGGVKDMIRLFRDLKNRPPLDVLDDGRVENNMSLADKAAMEAVSRGNTGRN